ncbi:B3 domain-containing transcription factor VRN1-like [Arachis hypogaea]|uniref:B3 domain-containing transcription factor VRN1-like n=1 Tax=Arachis hypogaea TaxID=3818 RepID=A0A6B9VAH8_ARAHY|nr:B3 domain-containing transcription factor VRN1-like [Arachis hypogaea]
MSQESLNDLAISPADLEEPPTEDLIDTLQRRMRFLSDSLQSTQDEARTARMEAITAKVRASIRKHELDECRRLEKKLHTEVEQHQTTIRELEDNANALKAEEHAKGDVVRVIKAAGEPSRPMRLPLPSGLLPKGSNHIYITVADGSDRTYKIACSPKWLKEITLGRGWQRFYHDYKLQPFNILLFKHKGRDDFSVRIFKAPGVERTYAASGDDSGDLTPPQVPTNRPRAPQKPRRRTGCINVPRSAAVAEVEQTFQFEHAYFIMHITERLLRVHFLPNVPHFGDDVSDDVMVTLRAGEISVRADYARYRGNRSRNCGTIGGGWADFLRKCNVTVEKLAVFEISRTNPDVELLVQFVDFERIQLG